MNKVRPNTIPNERVLSPLPISTCYPSVYLYLPSMTSILQASMQLVLPQHTAPCWAPFHHGLPDPHPRLPELWHPTNHCATERETSLMDGLSLCQDPGRAENPRPGLVIINVDVLSIDRVIPQWTAAMRGNAVAYGSMSQ